MPILPASKCNPFPLTQRFCHLNQESSNQRISLKELAFKILDYSTLSKISTHLSTPATRQAIGDNESITHAYEKPSEDFLLNTRCYKMTQNLKANGTADAQSKTCQQQALNHKI